MRGGGVGSGLLVGDDGCGGVWVGGLGDVFEVGLWCD